MYKITLQDGTTIDNLELNGNNFISNEIISENIFENNLAKVSIFEDGIETVYHDMKVIQVMHLINQNQTWFILAEKSKEELEKELIKKEINEQAEIIADIIGGVFNA